MKNTKPRHLCENCGTKSADWEKSQKFSPALRARAQACSTSALSTIPGLTRKKKAEDGRLQFVIQIDSEIEDGKSSTTIGFSFS